jgi:hypothetical protein
LCPRNCSFIGADHEHPVLSLKEAFHAGASAFRSLDSPQHNARHKIEMHYECGNSRQGRRQVTAAVTSLIFGGANEKFNSS